jgi:hypothetical protein
MGDQILLVISRLVCLGWLWGGTFNPLVKSLGAISDGFWEKRGSATPAGMIQSKS